MNKIKSTKNSVYDQVWLNKNIKAFCHKTWKIGDPTPLFASVYSSQSDMLWEHEILQRFIVQTNIHAIFATIRKKFAIFYYLQCFLN